MVRDDVSALVIYGSRGREASSIPYLSDFFVTAKAYLVFPGEADQTLVV